MKCSKEFISTKLEYELLKNSKLYKTDLKQYILKLLDLELRLKSIIF